jgi:transposase-like protein
MHPVSNDAPRRPRRRSAEQWRSIIARFQESGLKPREFCKQEGLAEATFGRWRRRFLAEAGRPDFVELLPSSPSVKGSGSEFWELELDLPGGGSLRLRGGR